MTLNKISIYTVLFIILAAILVQFEETKWNTDFGVVQGDVKGYYAYLPLFFIYDDIKIEHYEQYKYKNNYRIWCATLPNGAKRIKYTMGMAILYAPFFFIAHLFALIFHYPPDGFSLPYQFLLAMSSLFYLAVGLFALRKMLKLYFDDRVVAIVILIIYLATNLFFYYTERQCVSHGYSLAIVVVFLYASIMWLTTHKILWVIIVGITGGIMVLIRPVDIIFLLFPLLFMVNTWRSFFERLKLVYKYRMHLIFSVLLFCIILLPQFLYWKHISGNFFFDSYTNEHFYLLNPKIFRAVFSYRNGWLLYSPVMVFSVIGIFQSRKNYRQFLLPFLIIVPIYIYVISSWWCWWYAGFGNRAFINLYPLLSFGLAICIQYILKRKNAIKTILLLLIGGFIALNLFQTYQKSVGAIHWGSMSKEAYWDSFGRTSPSQLFSTYLRWEDTEEAKAGNYVILQPNYQNVIDKHINFEGKHESNFVLLDFDKAKTGPSFSGTKSFPSKQNSLYALNVKFPLLDADEVYLTVWVKNNINSSMVLTRIDSIPFYKSSKEHIRSKKGWEKLNIFARFEAQQKPDSLHFYIYNISKNEIWLDDLHITARKVSYQAEKVELGIF